MNLPAYNGIIFLKLLYWSEPYANFKQKSVTVMRRKYHMMMVYFLSQLQRWMVMIRSARECHLPRENHLLDLCSNMIGSPSSID